MARERGHTYWRSNLRYVGAVLAAWFAVSFVAGILLADALDAFRLGGFPLGFWFAEQGAILAFVALVWIYVVLMNALDRAHDVYEP
jgi:putative solute:sodium symporter small subunit